MTKTFTSVNEKIDWNTASDEEFAAYCTMRDKYLADKERYFSLINELIAVEKTTDAYLTDVGVDAENAGVAEDHVDFWSNCYASACSAAGFRGEEAGLDINKLLGRSIY